MTQHTPGPWEYGSDTRDRMRVFAAGWEIVRALSTHGGRRLSPAEREANARLIAAGPAMLAALREALFVLQSVAAGDPGWSQAAFARDAASAAITKAERRS